MGMKSRSQLPGSQLGTLRRDSGLEAQHADLMSPLPDSQSSALLISGLGSVPGNGQCQISEVVLKSPRN